MNVERSNRPNEYAAQTLTQTPRTHNGLAETLRERDARFAHALRKRSSTAYDRQTLV
jgi:hypothetical protein